MNTGIDCLPAELLLKIARYLSVQTLRSLKISSRYLNNVISEPSNEWTVYHNAALYHEYALSDSMTISEAKLSNGRYPVQDPKCVDWKEYCRQCFILDKNWSGTGSEEKIGEGLRAYCTKSHDVHRFQVDEERGLLFASSKGDTDTAAISVISVTTGELLWQTPSKYARSKAHIEYDEGYLVFDRRTGQKEVWRLRSSMHSSVSASPPDQYQIRASNVAKRRFGRGGPGRLRPWALLTTPDITRAYRLAYPALLVASRNTAYIWDITSATLVQTLHGLQTMQNGGRPLGEIHYVDVNPHHVVLCGENEVRVLSRENHTVVLRLSSEPGFARTILTPHLPPGSNKIPLIVRLETDVRSLAGEGHWGSFRAAHLSTSGHDLACMLADGRLVLVRHFERVVNGGTPIKDATLEVDLTHVNGRSGAQSEAGYYLAFEQDRVAIATSSGLYIMTLDAHTRGLLDPEALPRGHNSLAVGPSRSPDGPSSGALSSDVLVSWLPRLHDSAVLKEISCLQMSATCLYLTWKASRVDLVSRGASYGTFAVIYDEDPTFVDESTDYWTGRPMGSGLPVPIRRNPGLVVSCVDFSP